MAQTTDEGLAYMKRYIETGEGSLEEFRMVARRQVAKLQARIATSPEQNRADTAAWVEQSKKEPLACDSDETNDKIYDYNLALWKATYGSTIKVSAGLWPLDRQCSLTDAEIGMLDLYVERAEIKDGQDILDLGCGYGSVAFHLARRFPNSHIVAHSKAAKQIDYIKSEAERLGLSNVSTNQADINDLDLPLHSFDRIVAIGVVDYLSNYEELFARMSRWLRPSGLLFIELCVHATTCHEPREIEADHTGEVSRSFDFLEHFQRDLSLKASWWVDGRMFGWSNDAWLANWHEHRRDIMATLRAKHGDDTGLAEREYRSHEWYFVMSSESTGFNDGKTSGPAHYLFCNDKQ